MNWTRIGLCSVAILCCLSRLAASQPGCKDPDACRPTSGMIPIIVTILSADMVNEDLDGDFEVFGLGWENEADLYPVVTINGERFVGPEATGQDEPSWNWSVTVLVPEDSPGPVEIDIELWDDDPDLPTDSDDPVDLDQVPGDAVKNLSFDPCSQIVVEEDVLGGPGHRAGTPFSFGPGDGEDHAQLTVKVETGELVAPPGFCDVAITGMDLLQVVDDATVAIAGRPAVMRVRMESTFDTDISTTVVLFMDDLVVRTVRSFPVDIPACGVVDTILFTDGPVVITPGSNHVFFGGKVDPAGEFDPGTDAPPCMFTNNGTDDGEGVFGDKVVRNVRSLSVTFVRYGHGGGDHITTEEQEIEADSTTMWVEGMFPVSLPIEVTVDPDRVTGTEQADLRSEIQSQSVAYMMTGQDRVVGLVLDGWIDAGGYALIPAGTPGVSLGKYAPHFVVAEINTDRLLVPTHELGHTFGLSEEPCEQIGIEAIWECEDEYNDAPAFPEPFIGSGYDARSNSRITGTCFMNDDEPAWISLTDFHALAKALVEEPDPRVLVVAGFVTTDGAGELTAARGLESGIPDRTGPTHSTFAIVARNGTGEVLGTYGIPPATPSWVFEDQDEDGVLDGDTDANGIPDCLPVAHSETCPDTMRFAFRIPWPASATELAIIGPGGDVATLFVAEAAIPIELVSPIGDLLVNPGDQIPIVWRFPGGVPERMQGTPDVLIAASYDGGQKWLPRAIASGTEYTLDASGLERSVLMRLRLYSLQNGMCGVTPDVPTPTVLQSFSGASTREGVLLRWRVSEGSGFLGYHLHRQVGSGAATRITSEPLPAVPGPNGEHSFLDAGAQPGSRCRYVLSGVKAGGAEAVLGEVLVPVPGRDLALVRTAGGFRAVFPPFAEGKRFVLRLYDLQGRLVSTVAAGNAQAGEHEVPWDGSRAKLAAGVYLARLEVDGRSAGVKLSIFR